MGADLPVQAVVAVATGQPTGLVAAPDAASLLDQLTDGVVVVDGAGTVRLLNAAAGRLFGVTAAESVGKPLIRLIPPRFRAAHRAGFARFVATGEGRLVGGRPIRVVALRRDGTEVPVELSLGALGAPGDPGFAVVATLRDVTGRVELEHQLVLSRYLRASVNAARDGVLAVSPERRVLAVNRRFCELWGLPPDAVPVGGKSPALLAGCLDQVVDVKAFEDAIRWGHAHPSETQTLDVPLVDGRVIEGYAAPILDDDGSYLGRVWYLRDDTERRADEAQRTALLTQLAASQRTQRFLLDASTVLAHASGFAETLESLAAIAVPTLGDLCLIDVLDDDGRMVRMAAVHADPARQPLVDELRRRYPPDPVGRHPGVEAIRNRESRWSPEMPEAFLRDTTRDERHLRIVQELGFTSYMSVPLVADDRALGSVTLVSAGSGRRFGPSDLALADELAGRVALVVAKERRYDEERRSSHTLQTSLLPTDLPTIAGVEYAVRYLPGTRDAEVGGDFWDVVQMPSGEAAFAVGDVAGHDITAAATMAQLRSACRALRAQTDGPGELVRLVHGTWDQLGLQRIATAVFARLRPDTGLLRIASAGHLPPLIVEPDRAWFPALDPAAPFGAPPTAGSTWRGTIPPGSVVVLYTDGLVEDRQRDIDEGTGRLIRAAMTAPCREPGRLADHVLTALSGEDRGDDVALLVVRRVEG